MKKIIKLIRILFKKRVNEYDLQLIWLILFHWTDDTDVKKFECSRDFFLYYKVKKWQYNLWRRIAFYKVRRVRAVLGWGVVAWIGDIPIYFFYRYLPSKDFTRRGFAFIDLKISPSHDF